MYAQDTRDPTFTVVLDGKALGQVTRPVDARVFGRNRGTVYLARPVLRRKRNARGGAAAH